jgi:hypothetical protein
MMLWALPTSAAEQSTGAYHAYSIVSCGQLMEYKRRDDLFLIDWYASGYLTAFNRMAPDTYNIAGSTDIPSVRLWIEQYCLKEPLSDVTSGLAVLTRELFERRQTARPR